MDVSASHPSAPLAPCPPLLSSLLIRERLQSDLVPRLDQSPPPQQQRLVKQRTQLRYAQVKFNLLREESEGLLLQRRAKREDVVLFHREASGCQTHWSMMHACFLPPPWFVSLLVSLLFSPLSASLFSFSLRATPSPHFSSSFLLVFSFPLPSPHWLSLAGYAKLITELIHASNEGPYGTQQQPHAPVTITADRMNDSTATSTPLSLSSTPSSSGILAPSAAVPSLSSWLSSSSSFPSSSSSSSSSYSSLLSVVESLIGYFDLDPNRVIDLILCVAECCLQTHNNSTTNSNIQGEEILG